MDGAWKNIQEADGLFADGDIASAYAKYSQVTTDLEFMPDAWFRLSYTEVARGNYEAAADFCKKGLNASRLWPASPFSMDYMYQSASDRKEKAFAALETAAVNAPGNSDLNLVAGFTFYSDGQNDKAAKFLKIAEKLSPDLEEFIEPVLKAIP